MRETHLVFERSQEKLQHTVQLTRTDSENFNALYVGLTWK